MKKVKITLKNLKVTSFTTHRDSVRGGWDPNFTNDCTDPAGCFSDLSCNPGRRTCIG